MDLDQILEAAEPYLKAAIILIVGLILAKIISGIITRLLHRTSVDERIAKALRIDAEGTEKAFGRFVYYILLLFVVVMALEVAGLERVTQPLFEILNQIAAFIPGLLAAILILIATVVIANLARNILSGLLGAANIDERLGVADGRPVSRTLCTIAYFLIILTMLPAILGQLGIERVSEPISALVNEIWAYTPHLLSGIAVFALGLLIATIVQKLVQNVLSVIQFDRLPARLGFSGTVEIAGHPPSVIVSYVAMGTVLIVAFGQAVQQMQLDFIGDGVTEQLIPAYFRILGGLVLFLFGIYLANLAQQALLERSVRWARIARISILLIVGAMALQVANLSPIGNQIFERFLTGIIIAATLAFGIGGAIAIGMGGRHAVQRYLDRKVP